ncbi:hypothetical protein ACIBCT_35225 [Streptosporangium sp. NPDC050855]|uniref:beta barrel domain-containing protein n=1 Tax=Streptosporangium sp. NPDC050855 TaxID=3366194 RepID=UPI0037A9CA51
MIEVKEGDEVRLFESYYSGSRQPGGQPGIVKSVRRTLFDAEFNGNGTFTRTFRLEDGYLNEKNSRTYVKTVAQAEQDVRYNNAMNRLQHHKIAVRDGHKLDLDQLEALVALLDTFEAEESA